MIACNEIKLKDLEILGVNGTISRLFMSKNDGDFLIAWELVESHPNRDYIRAYCKGNTSTIEGLLNYDWDEKGSIYYNYKVREYRFGDIIIQN